MVQEYYKEIRKGGMISVACTDNTLIGDKVSVSKELIRLKNSFPSTRAIHFLRQHEVKFNTYLYHYTSSGNVAKDAATALGVSESEVFKTLVFINGASPLLVLIDAGHRAGLHQLSRIIGGGARVVECSPRDAERYTGYKVGGISPFGTRRSMPVYLDSSALDLQQIYVNGGSHGFMVSLFPSEFIRVLNPVIGEFRTS
jgi:Cys-tRNA(Pro) deacylase